MRSKPYPSDLTDAQWAVLKPLLPPNRALGRPRKTGLREIVDALLDRNRNGRTWRALPHDFPPWRTGYNYFQKGRDAGTREGGKRRPPGAGREEAGRGTAPASGRDERHT